MILTRKTKFSHNPNCKLLKAWLNHFINKGYDAEIRKDNKKYAVYVIEERKLRRVMYVGDDSPPGSYRWLEIEE